MGTWDDSFKLFIGENAQDLVNWLWSGVLVKRKLLTEFKVHTIEADSLLELERKSDGYKFLFHVEIQSTRDPDIPERLLQYSFEARRAHNLPVYACVIYIRDVGEVPQPPLHWEHPDGGDILWFHYMSIELAKLPMQELKQTGLVGLLPLFILTRDGATRPVMEEVVNELGIARQFGLLSISKLLAPLVFKSDEDQDWLERIFSMHEDPLSESPVYQKILKQGIEKGIEQGIEKGIEQGIEKGREEGLEQGIEKGKIAGLQMAVLEVVEERFPPLKELAEQKVVKATKPETLNLVFKGLMRASDEASVRLLLDLLAA